MSRRKELPPRTGELELRHLRVLVALGEEGTFTDAAIRLGLSQPAVSRTLAQLERILGVQLVQRTTRRLDLTAAGRSCSAVAAAVLDAAGEGVVDAAQGRVRPLRLGYAWAAFGPYTTAILRAWRREHPDIALEVHRVDDRSAGLRRGVVDLAVRRGPVDDPGVRVDPIFAEGRVAAVPAGATLAGRASLVLADLVDEVIALAPESGTTTLELWPLGGRPERAVEVANTDEWLIAIASGEAVGVTSESTPSQHPHPDVRFVPLADAPRLTVSLVSPAALPHPAVGPFTAVVRRCIEAAAPSPEG